MEVIYDLFQEFLQKYNVTTKAPKVESLVLTKIYKYTNTKRTIYKPEINQQCLEYIKLLTTANISEYLY